MVNTRPTNIFDYRHPTGLCLNYNLCTSLRFFSSRDQPRVFYVEIVQTYIVALGGGGELLLKNTTNTKSIYR